MKPTNKVEVDPWDRRIRMIFRMIGVLGGALLTYTSRHFINGDAIAYIEMGEALRNGQWWGLVNLTYSPGYPVLLAIGQTLLGVNPLNELQILKVVNLVCLVAAMEVCDILVRFVRKELQNRRDGKEPPLPLPAISALCYSMFLVAALSLVRMRLLNPDMLILLLVLTCMAVSLWIRENPEQYYRYAVLGAAVGSGYLAKSFFLVFSPVFFLTAGLCAASLKKALGRTAVAAGVMLIVTAPLITALSFKLGRFTYGELGKLAYAQFVSGTGTPFRPKVIHEAPATFLYRSETPETRPSGFDICYWQEGLQPDFNPFLQLKLTAANAVDLVAQCPWLVLLVLWMVLMWRMGSIRIGGLSPPSLFWVLMIPSVAGTGFYLLIHVEPRYLGSFFFLGFTGVVASLRMRADDPASQRRMNIMAWAMTGFLMAMVVHSAVDQSFRGLYSSGGKLSYRDAFLEHVAVKDFLVNRGLTKGDEVGVIGSPPVHWARMAGVKIVAETPETDEFFSTTESNRKAVLDAMRNAGIKAVLAKGRELERLKSEGWQMVPRTADYYGVFLK